MPKNSKKNQSKNSRKLCDKNSFYFGLLDLIREGKSLVEVASELNISKQNLNYHLKPLKVYKAISSIGKGVWQINDQKFREFLEEKIVKNNQYNTPKRSKKKIRGHAFKFSFKIPLISSWKRREDFLIKNKINFKKILQGQSITTIIGKHEFKVWLCRKSIVVNFPKTISYLTKTSKESYLNAIYDAKRVMIHLENLFSISLKLRKKYQYKLSRHHYSHIENELAKDYVEKKKIVFIRDKFGILWGLIDNSFQLHEFETLNTKTAIKDMDKVVKPYFDDFGDRMIDELNDRRDNPETPVSSMLYKMIIGLTKAQQNTNINLEQTTHLLKKIAQRLNDL